LFPKVHPIHGRTFGQTLLAFLCARVWIFVGKKDEQTVRVSLFNKVTLSKEFIQPSESIPESG
jgi:hypothetical protein